MRDNVLVSFSGGRTSSLMAKLIKENLSDKNLLFVFANTGEEHEKTLDFVHKCDIEFGLNLVWIEAKVHVKGKSSTSKVVSYETASRDGEPLKNIISRYGIFNKSYPHCNRESKIMPIHHYAREYFNGEKYSTAIGIRVDESHRVAKSVDNVGFGGVIYPLIDIWPMDKIDVNDFWDSMSFNLDIPEHYGNCKTCWKKSARKLMTIACERPEWFNFNREMEKLHSRTNVEDGYPDRVFFRGNKSTDDIFNEAETVNFNKFIESRDTQIKLFGYDMSEESSCTDECHPY